MTSVFQTVVRDLLTSAAFLKEHAAFCGVHGEPTIVQSPDGQSLSVSLLVRPDSPEAREFIEKHGWAVTDTRTAYCKCPECLEALRS